MLTTKELRVYVDRYDSMHGVDPKLCKIIETNLDNCKAQAEGKVAEVQRVNRKLAEEVTELKHGRAAKELRTVD